MTKILPKIDNSDVSYWFENVSGSACVKPTIIVVSDMSNEALAWSRGLTNDFRLIPARNAAQAFEALNTLSQTELLIVDLAMKKLDGAALLRSAQSLYPDIPCILLAADHDHRAIDNILGKAEINDVLFMPLGENEIRSYVSAAISVARARACRSKSGGLPRTTTAVVSVEGEGAECEHTRARRNSEGKLVVNIC